MGKPRVNYLEAITKRVDFDYLHKKQTGAKVWHVQNDAHIAVDTRYLFILTTVQQTEWVLCMDDGQVARGSMGG